MIVSDGAAFEARIDVVKPGVKGDIFEFLGDDFCFGNAGVGEMNVDFRIGIVKAGDVVISLTMTDDIEVHSKPLSEFLLARTNTSVSWVILIIY